MVQLNVQQMRNLVSLFARNPKAIKVDLKEVFEGVEAELYFPDKTISKPVDL